MHAFHHLRPLTCVAFMAMFAAARPAPAGEIPQPRAVIDFDKSSQLEITGEQPQLIRDDQMGALFKTDQLDTTVSWNMARARMSWERATISFWIQPVDWSGEPRWRYWLFSESPRHGRRHHLSICQFAHDGREFPHFQLMDLNGYKPHLWNPLTKYENGKWYFITAAWDRDVLNFYINGEQDPEGSGTFGFTKDYKIGAETFEDSYLVIGTSTNYGYPATHYQTRESTLMSRVEIRDERLTDEQVRELYYRQRPAGAADGRPTQVAFAIPPAPRLTVPADASAPVIGAFDDAQWQDATVITGINDGNKGVLSDKPFKAYIKSDGEKLYIALRTKVPQTAALVTRYTERDSDTPLDDSWELFIYPGLDTSEFYQAVVNSEGVIFDWYKKQTDWNGNWQIEQRVEAPNTWDAEMAIPLKDLGHAGSLDGVQWRIGLYVNQRGIEDMSYTYAPLLGLFENPNQIAAVTFRNGANNVGLSSLGKPTAGNVEPVMAWTQPGAKAAAILTDSAGVETRRVIAAAGLPEVFPPLVGKGEAKLTILSPPDATPDTADFHYSTIIPYDSVPLTVRATNYPSKEQLTLELNYGLMASPQEIKAYRVEVGGMSHDIERTSDIPWERIGVSTRDVKPGPTTCAISLLDEAGDVKLTRQIDYIKEGAEPWLNNKVGIIPGHVPPPYTPIQIDGRTVGVIGRTITFADTGLPEQIVAAGETLLAAPVTIRGEVSRKQTTLEAAEALTYNEAAPDDSHGQAAVRLGPMAGTIRQTVSFDGFIWYEVDLQSDSPVDLSNVSIDIPMNAEAALHYQLTEADILTMGIEGWEMGDMLTGNITMPFATHVYLGNDTAGLAWFAESKDGWQLARDERAIMVRRQDGRVVLRINIVDNPIDLTELKFAFGLQPTPVKPITDTQQRYAISPGRWPEWDHVLNYGVYQGQNPQVPENVVAYSGMPEPANPDLARAHARERNKTTGFFTPYAEITWLSMGVEEFKTYGGDWYLNQPWAGTAGAAADPEPFGLMDMENDDYRDFIAWRFVNSWDGYDGSSVYFDLFSPMPDKLPEHERGYATRSGRTEYPVPLLAMRDLARRLYIGYKQKNPDFAIFLHASNQYVPLLAFGDAWPIGENFGGAPMRYPQILPYERYRAWLYGYPMGVKTFFLPSLKSPAMVTEQPQLTNYLIGVVYNHNTAFWTCFINQAVMLPYHRRYHGLDLPRAQFLPYWDHPNLTTLDSEKFKVSGWYDAGKNRGYLMIASLSAEPTTAPIALGKGWPYPTLRTLSNPIPASEFGDYQIPATFDGAGAQFASYGVLMLEVR